MDVRIGHYTHPGLCVTKDLGLTDEKGRISKLCLRNSWLRLLD